MTSLHPPSFHRNDFSTCNITLKLFSDVAMFNKWKIHFYEMKGDVGMSVHEKERKQDDAYTKTQTHS